MRASTTSGDEVPPNSSALRRVERHAGGQSSPGAGTGMDLERAAERFHALHHAEQPEALTPRGLDVESHAIVADGHREPVGALLAGCQPIRPPARRVNDSSLLKCRKCPVYPSRKPKRFWDE